MKPNAFAEEALRLGHQIHVQLLKRMPAMIGKGAVSFPQIVILDILRRAGKCRMGRLSKVMGVTNSAVTGMTDRLIQTGILKRARSTCDRRVVYVGLTKKGASLARKLNNYKVKMIKSLFSSLTGAERAAYLKILRKITEKSKNA